MDDDWSPSKKKNGGDRIPPKTKDKEQKPLVSRIGEEGILWNKTQSSNHKVRQEKYDIVCMFKVTDGVT